MGELWRSLVDSLEHLWPLHIVEQWEVGGYYIFGRFWKIVQPGMYFVLPWFTNIINVSSVPAIIGTKRSDITVRGGGTLSFEATAVVRVVDANKALNEVDRYQESTQELLGSVLSELLADVEPERLQPERRARLSLSLVAAVQKEAEAFGVHVDKIRFPAFILNARVYRLLGETSPATPHSW